MFIRRIHPFWIQTYGTIVGRDYMELFYWKGETLSFGNTTQIMRVASGQAKNFHHCPFCFGGNNYVFNHIFSATFQSDRPNRLPAPGPWGGFAYFNYGK
jgi:hypothetical protein